MSFDSSLFDNVDEKFSKEEYRYHLSEQLQPILNQRFPNSPGKRKIRPHHDRITFSCPYCGDSQKNDYKKRGNFILSGKYSNYYKCHNCNIFKPITEFFNDYSVQLDLQAINFISENIGDISSSSNINYDMSLFLDIDNIEKYAIDREDLKKAFNLEEAKTSSIWKWLSNRHQFDDSRYLYNRLKNYLLILNLTPNGKILGAQKRMFKGNNRFLTFKLSSLYNLMNKSLDVDEQKKQYLDTLSMIFNICLININLPVILQEGPMDSFLIKNSIANTGANKELPIDIPVLYLYDYDETGIKKTIEHINKNDAVFLWGKYLRHINAPSRKKWDINDIFIWANKNNVKLPSVLQYFSSDSLDIIDI